MKHYSDCICVNCREKSREISQTFAKLEINSPEWKALDEMYAAAEAYNVAASEEEADAAYEQSYDHLNKIAGDRR